MLIDPMLYATYVGTVLILALTPGTDNIYIITRTLAQGRSAGFLAAGGVALALVIHVSAITLGLSQLFIAAPDLYAAVRWAGIGYLVWLAWRAFRAAPETRTMSATAGNGPAPGRIIRQAFTLCLLNPKLAVFFIAFLPQFTDPAGSSITMQLFVLGLTFALLSLLVFSGFIIFVAPIGDLLRHHPAFERWQTRLSGTVFAAMALWLSAQALEFDTGGKSP